MKVLLMGKPFGTPIDLMDRYRRRGGGHEIRTLACEGPADFSFDAGESITEVLGRIRGDFAPDLFICWCPENLPPPLRIEESPVRTIAILSDWTVYYPQLADNLGRFDVVVADRSGSSTLSRPDLPVHYIGPLYSQRTSIHYPREVERDLDIVFAGNLNPAVHDKRGRLLDRVAACSAQWRVVIASELSPEDYAVLYSRAKIVFNHSLRREMNLRCFEGPACGALLFVEESNLEVAEILRPEEECILYREENLIFRLNELLEDPEKYEAIRSAGYARILENSGECRLDDLLAKIAELPDSGRPFFQREERPSANSRRADILLYGASQAAAQQALAPLWIEEALHACKEDVFFKEAQGVILLEKLRALTEEERRAQLPEALAFLKDAVVECPESIPFWINLAFAARLAGTAASEHRFLEKALEAENLSGSALLMGDRRDPYYAQWRVKEAMGKAEPALLYGSVACRLAQLSLDESPQEAMRWATYSGACWPGMAAPYEVLAAAEEQLGRPERALSWLERSLAMTSLDSEHRAAMVRLYLVTGQPEKARWLQEESLCIFYAWWGAEHAAARFASLDSFR